MPNASHVQPRLALLSADQMAYTHAQSIKLLETVGVHIESVRARNLLAGKIGTSTVRGERVHLPGEIVEWALKSAPSTVDLYNRLGNPQFQLGDGKTHFGIGVTNLYYQDPQTDEVTHFNRKHMEAGVRLGHVLPRYDVISTLGILRELDPNIADMYAVLEMAANTTKPLVLLVSNASLFPSALAMLEKMHGDLSGKPFLMPYLNPVTPLVANKDTTDKMFTAIDHGLPVIYSNYGMAGMSTPITPAGTLVLLNAELLFGLTLSQLIKECTPMVMGSLPAWFDMGAMVDFYDPNTILINLAVAEMMKHYHLPHAGTSGSGTGWGADLIESGTLWLNHLTSILGQAELVPFIGGVHGSMAFSPASVVHSHDIIGRANHFAKGFQLTDETVGFNEIMEAGPGGSFGSSDLTLELHKTAHYKSDLYPTLSLATWQSNNRPNATHHLRETTRDIMASAQPPQDHDDWIGHGEQFIKELQKNR